MSSFIFSFWAQQPNGIVELLQLLFVLLLIVVPAVIKFFAAQTAQKNQRQLEEQSLEEQLREAFNAAVAEESGVRPRPKPAKKRKPTELVLELDDDRSARGSPLVRELAPQGEGARFDASPGTFDSSLALTPSVEPTVQPTLDSMTGIYDAPPDSEHLAQTALAVDIYQMLTTPSGIRQAVVLGEILKRPEY